MTAHGGETIDWAGEFQKIRDRVGPELFDEIAERVGADHARSKMREGHEDPSHWHPALEEGRDDDEEDLDDDEEDHANDLDAAVLTPHPWDEWKDKEIDMTSAPSASRTRQVQFAGTRRVTAHRDENAAKNLIRLGRSLQEWR